MPSSAASVSGASALNSNLILLILGDRFSTSMMFGKPLNSNLILLILGSSGDYAKIGSSFKFQSDSINTETMKELFDIDFIFKFQSDSINTKKQGRTGHHYRNFKFQSDSINTVPAIGKQVTCYNFKFQSDSINTRLSVQALLFRMQTLNSNLILLILTIGGQQYIADYALNSNLILLIPHGIPGKKSRCIIFKFQSDSINTPKANNPNRYWCTLNSNLILLIQRSNLA